MWRGLSTHHKKQRWLSFAAALLVCLASLTAAFPANAATTVVGTIPGSFSVTATGAATYAIPIRVPRGSGGLTPSIALVYNSQSGSGAAGWGWTISGLSAITRCNQTIDDDGVTQAVQLASTDDYCLDDQRLRVTSGTSGNDGATFDTEIRSYSLITEHNVSGDTGGPSYWTVQTRDGTTYEYGYTTGNTGSRIYATNTTGGAATTVRVWALDKVTDANGNYYTITYQNNDASTGDYWPTDIEYTGNTHAVNPLAHDIHFTWRTRADDAIQTRFVHGTLVTQTQVLTGISVEYNSATTFSYALTYNAAPPAVPADNRYQLTSIQECDANSDCFPATAITWQPGAAGWQTPVKITGISGLTAAQAVSAHVVDVNGDGIADLLYPGSSDWMVLFGQPNGVFGSSPVDTGIPVGNYQWALATDANGDGRMDLMVPGTDGSWHVYEATGNISGTIFTPVATGQSDTGINSQTNLPIYEGNAAMMDSSGRGLGDFLYSDGSTLWRVPNNGPTSNPQFGTRQNMGSFGDFSDDIVQRESNFVDAPMDFDGSGRVGLLGFSKVTHTSPCNPQDQPGCVPNSTTTYYWSAVVSTPSGFQNAGTLTCWDNTMTPMPLDATGGGLTDLVYACAATNVFNFELSTGTKFLAVPTTIPYAANSSTDPVFADYYGDGREEAIVPNSASGTGWTRIRVNYDPSTPGFTAALPNAPAPYPDSYVQGSLRVGNLDASGLDGLLFAEDNGGSYSFYYALHTQPTPPSQYPNSGGIADTVVNITNGLDNSYSPSYAPLTNTSSYAENSGAIYPVQDVKAPLAVVTSYSASDGIGGFYTETYSYTGAETEVTGRGFLGFASRSVSDSRNGVTVADSYDQTFPWIGNITQENINQANGKALSTSVNTYISSPSSCSGGGLCFPYLSASTVTVNDAGTGNTVKTVQTQNTFGDGYGDLTNQTVTTTDNTTGAQLTTTTATGYTPDTSNYCIDLPTSMSVTKTSPEGTFTRNSTSPQDQSACRPLSVTLNQGSSPTLTTTYTYDDWGNPATITVSGTGLSTEHLTTLDYGTYYGEYPDSISPCAILASPLTVPTTCSQAQASTEVWDPSRGVETSVTDPNGHQTSWAYDGFGRRLSETNGEGVVTTWSKPTSYSGAGCPSSVSCYEITDSETSGCWYTVYPCNQTVPLGFTAYDSRGRIIETGKILLGGATSYVQTQYDALGRAVQVSRPALSTTPMYWTDTSYDVLNRPTQITAPANAANGSGDVTTIGYNGFTTTTSATAPNTSGISSEQTVTVTDALGEVISKTDGSEAANTTYTYDPFGDLVKTKDADSSITTMKYDALGHKYTMIDPNMGTWSYGVDALGEVLSQTDADGNAIAQIYDALGRLTSRTEKNSSGTTTANDTWTWDSATHGIGLLASESDSVSDFQKTYSYNGLSLPETVSTTVSGTTYNVDTGYDNFGRVANVEYPASAAPTVPVASAVATPTSTVVGSNINLNGSGSTDPSGLTLSYQWSGSSTLGFADPTGETTAVTANTPGAYTIQLVVSDANTSSNPASVSVSFTPPVPSTPSISQTPQYSGSYSVNWGSVSGASSYEVYESNDGTDFGNPNTVTPANPPPTTITDSITGQTTGTYYYKVAACANGACSTLSASSAAVQVILPPSAAPSNVQAQPNPSSDGNFTLSWNGVTGATYYNVYRSGTGTPVKSPSSASTPLTQGDGTDTYYVTACNQGGCGPSSGTVSEAVTIPPGTPGTPSGNPNPSITSPSSFILTWSQPSGGPGWTSGALEESTDQVNWTVETSWSYPTNTTTWPGGGSSFGNGTYYFRVRYCESSCSGTAVSYSGIGSETVYLPPGAPTSLYGSPNPSANGDYTLYWTAPSSGTVTGYNIYNSGGGYVNTVTNTYASFGGIADGTYSYYVTACNHSACGPASNTASETVLHPPGVPGSVSLDPTSTYTLDPYTLSWSQASGTVSYYEINGSSSLETSGLSYQFQGKVKAGSYSYHVQACNSSGCSADSATVTETISSPPGGGGGCPPKPYQCQVMTKPGGSTTTAPGSSTTAPPPSGNSGSGGLTGAAGVPGGLSLAPNGSAVLVALARTRRALAAHVILEPSEAELQQAAVAREHAALPSLLPLAPAKDLAAWNSWDAQWKQAHPNGPEFAPPEYIAWSGAKLEPASGSTYRFEVQYNYDPQGGALLSVSNYQTGFVYWQADTSPGPDAFGHLQGWSDGNNVSTVMAYDAATGAPVGISTDSEINGKQVVDQLLTYSWDGYGNLEQRCDVNRSLAENVTDDDLNRLTGTTVYTGVSVSGSSCAGGSTTNSLSASYDPMGKILTKSNAGTYTYDPSHPYAVHSVTNSSGTTVYSASYDADGNMTSRNGSLIQWTTDNLPESIASATGSSTFNYGPDHARYAQAATDTNTGVTTDTTYIGGLFEVVSTSTGTTEYRHNIVADGEVIAVHTIDGNGAASTSYLHYDHLGSVDTITDDNGNVIQSMSFDAFGLRRDATNWDYDLTPAQIALLKNNTDRGFTFQEQLDNVGLIHMNGRVYDPVVGRFISADPTVPAPFYSQAFNRYSYAYNNPLRWIDPTGYDPNWALVGAGVIDTSAGLFDIAVSGALLYLAGESGGNYDIGAAALLVGVAGAYEGGVGGLEIYQGLEGYSQSEIPSVMSTTATAAGLATDPGNTLGQELIKQILLTKQDVINNEMNALIQKFKSLLPLKPPVPPNNSPTTNPTPSVGGGAENTGNGNNGGSLIQLPGGCGCDGSYTGPNEASPSNTINLGQIQVTALPPTTVMPPPPPPPPQPIKCMDGSGKVTTCPT